MSDYFNLFGLPISYEVDLEQIEKKYFELQNKYHPDRFMQANSSEKLDAVQKSISINDGYNILINDLRRSEYMLSLEGIKVNTDSDTNKPSPSLLITIMEYREQLSDATEIDEIIKLQDCIKIEKDNCINGIQEGFVKKNYKQIAALTIKLQFLNKILAEVRIKKLNI